MKLYVIKHYHIKVAQELKELLENAGYQTIILEDFQEITKNILKQNANLIIT